MSYGSTASHRSPVRHFGSSSTSRSVSTDAHSKPPHEDGRASVLSSVTNLANTVIGAGALAFPSAFAAMGLIPGIVSCVCSGCMTAFGLYLLSRCATQVGKGPGEQGRKSSFNELARLAFGKSWATRLFDLAIAIKCFGVSTSYLIICKTLLPQVSFTFAQVLHHPLPDHSLLLSQDFWLIVSMFVIVPLSFLRTLDSLRFASQVALGTVIYLLTVVIGWYVTKGPSPERGEVVLARFGRNTLSSFPVQVFAFTCAQNVFTIYNELEDKSQRRMNTVIVASLGSAAACYEILGVLGYLTFGNKVGSNIIAMYPPTSLFIAIGRLGIVLLVGLSYPLQLLPCRACVYTLTSGLIRAPRPRKPLPTTPTTSPRQQSGPNSPDTPGEEDDEEDEEDRLMPKDQTELRGVGAPREMRQSKFVGITVGILACGFSIALVVDELEVVLGFVGSTGSTILSFILPGFFYFRLFRKDRGPMKWVALALGMYGLAVMCFCLTFNIVNLEMLKVQSCM